jgi:MarR family transcriptional regulator, organic hydroperoxide resistance regulator
MPASKHDPSAQWLQLDQQLCFAMYSASLAMTRRYKPLLAPLGLTYPQYITLLALWERDGQTVSELGERLCLDSGTLTPLLKRMEGAGLLRRERAQADERCVLVHLAPAGQALRERAGHIPRQLVQATQGNTETMRELVSQLHALRDRLHDTAHQAPQADAQERT